MTAEQHLQWASEHLNHGLRWLKTQCATEGRLSNARLDEHQQATYDLALSTSEIRCAEAYLETARSTKGLNETMAETFAAQMIQSTLNRLLLSPQDVGLSRAALAAPETLEAFLDDHLRAEHLAKIGADLISVNGETQGRGLPEAQQMIADTFHQFADDVVAP